MANRLSIPAVRQILAKLAKGEKEEDELVEKLEDSCLRYDHDKKGVLPIATITIEHSSEGIPIFDLYYLDVDS